MQDKILNVVSVLLSIVTEIWVLRLFGANNWDDILSGVVLMVIIPVIILPFSIFQTWLRYIYCENKTKNKKSNSATQSTEQSAKRTNSGKYNETGNTETNGQDNQRLGVGQMFLYFVSALSAKIAKADGYVDASEISAVELSFRRLGLSEQQRKFCIETFQHSITSSESISSITRQLKASFFSDELKAIIYEILWDVACADGILTHGEKFALKTISEILELYSYERYYRQRVKKENQKQTGQHTNRSGGMSLDAAYKILGCSNSDTDVDIKSAYREKAKRNHPDLLKSQGLPEEMVSLATKRMAEINAAWEIIKKSRNL